MDKSLLARKIIMALSTKKLIAYSLRPSPDHVNEDLGYDAELVSFDGSDLFDCVMWETEKIAGHTVPVQFQGLLRTIRQTDYPVTNPRLPLMSKRMVAVLESVGTFQHQIIATRITDGAIGRNLSNKDNHYDESGNLKSEYYTDDYVLLQLTEHLDAMNLERSEYDDYDADMNLVSLVDKFVFKDIGREFPPIFCLTCRPGILFISEAAKEALEAAGMRSLWLTSYGDTEVEHFDIG
jgi:hypothetical protein